MPRPNRWRSLALCWCALGLAGCRALPPLAPVNLSEPGWNLQQGQAVWRGSRDAPEIAGELLLAVHPDGRAWLQFIKTPLPLVTAQVTPHKWQIEFIPEKRRLAGSGAPPARLIWLHLLRALQGSSPAVPLQFQRTSDGQWRLENTTTGEVLSGYLTLSSPPSLRPGPQVG